MKFYTLFYSPPSGLPWDGSTSANKQPYKFNGKEFIETNGLDEISQTE